MTVDTREERRSALDEFAASTKQELVPVKLQSAVSPMETVHGAQPVAVKRDDAAVLSKLKVLAAAAGEDWYYRFPVKNRQKGTTDFIEGPSIKLANDLSRIYGNCEVDCRAQDLGDHWLFHARFIDIETGYSLTRPFQQRKNASRMGGDEDRRLDIAFQIGASKAIRNVIVNALQTFADFAFDEAKQALVDKIGKRLEDYRSRTIDRLSAKLDIKRVESAMGRSAKEWLAPDIARIIATMKAVEDGMATLDESFPPFTVESKSTTASLDTFADGAGHATQPPPPSEAGATGADESPSPTSRSSADPFAALQRRLKDAPNEAAVHQLWEDLKLDEHYENDEPGRQKAWKLADARLKELRK
jgi:hypothetical protein